MSLHQSVLPSSISLVMDSLVGFGCSTCSGASTNRCLGHSYVFFVRWYFGMTLNGHINVCAQLSFCTVNIHLWVVIFGYHFWFRGYLFPGVLPGRINTPSLYSVNVCIRWNDIYWVHHYIMWGRMIFLIFYNIIFSWLPKYVEMTRLRRSST